MEGVAEMGEAQGLRETQNTQTTNGVHRATPTASCVTSTDHSDQSRGKRRFKRRLQTRHTTVRTQLLRWRPCDHRIPASGARRCTAHGTPPSALRWASAVLEREL